MREVLTDARRREIVARIKLVAKRARANNPVDNVSANEYPHHLNTEN